MPERRRSIVPSGRLLGLALLLGAPAAAALIGLVLLGKLAIVPAVAAGVVVIVLTAAVLRPIVADLLDVAAYLRADVDEERTPPEARYSEAARDVASAATFLRQRVQARLRGADARATSHAALLDCLPGPLFLIDAQRQVVRCNPAAEALLGRPAECRPLPAVVRDPAILAAVDAALDNGKRGELRVVFTGPVERNFEVLVEPLANASADGARLLLQLHDITELVRTEQMRADFVANASHELRTPLTSVLGFIETLRGPARDDQEAHDRFLAIMFQQATRMKRLIEDLLSLSRIELREHTPPTGRTDLRRILTGVADGLQIQAEDKGVGLVVTVPGDTPPVVGDADELTQVFQNLMSNAIKYGRAGTDVTVTVERVARGPAAMPHVTRADALVVHVRDAGDGIAKEHLPRLTERFYRVDTARSRELGGTGLGLAIVKHIVNRHRGALTIDSTVGKGSTFSVYLPPWHGE
ncbi:ATP-binding protein [Novispirillum sp. DQ9]|uniref:ATP-binding protein n=1 Tax=Novispirillum sp. DQ9 TaxID=3398612 RepID=UPI003C79D63D